MGDYYKHIKQLKINYMTQQEALEILVNGVNLAQSKGAYTLQEASVLFEAILSFKIIPDERIEEIKKEEVTVDS